MAGKLDLNKIKIGHSSLTDTLFIYRHGVDKKNVLDKREAEADVFSAIINRLMYGAPKGSTMKVTLGEDIYEISVKPIKK